MMEGATSPFPELSAMITPAVLILACSSLIAATSSRLGRTLDRARTLAVQFEEMLKSDPPGEQFEDKRELLIAQLERTASRAGLLQRVMVTLYVALAILMTTSIVIGVGVALERDVHVLLTLLGMAAVGLLLYASLLLAKESRIALVAIDQEMSFVRRLGSRPEAGRASTGSIR